MSRKPILGQPYMANLRSEQRMKDDAARAMLAALTECVHLMHADCPADGWKDAIDAGRAAIAQAEAAGIESPR